MAKFSVSNKRGKKRKTSRRGTLQKCKIRQGWCCHLTTESLHRVPDFTPAFPKNYKLNHRFAILKNCVYICAHTYTCVHTHNDLSKKTLFLSFEALLISTWWFLLGKGELLCLLSSVPKKKRQIHRPKYLCT